MEEKVYLIKESTLTGIADEIRVHTGGGSKKIKPENMREEISNVAQINYSNGEGMGYSQGYSVGFFDGEKSINDLVDATSVTAGSVLEGATFYKDEQTLTGTMPNNGTIKGRITPNATTYFLNEGYYSKGSTVSVYYQTDKIAYPSPNQQVVKSYTDTFLTQVTIEPISSLAKDYTFTNNGEWMYLAAIKPDRIGREDATDLDSYVINDWYPDGTVLSLIPGTMVFIQVPEGWADAVKIDRDDKYEPYYFMGYGPAGSTEGFFMLR